ncbi:MAG: CxxC-x17-CxxC domain-containing protein [Nanoarchaeota archaeon]
MAYGGGFRRGGGGFRRDFGPREMHKIKCSECGQEAEVPFKPMKDKPVYCRDCFMKRKGITPRDFPKKREEEEEAEEESEEEVEEESEEESD